MKAHMHTGQSSAANVADALALPQPLHGKEKRVWGDQAYRGPTKGQRQCGPHARDFTNQRCRWRERIDELARADR